MSELDDIMAKLAEIDSPKELPQGEPVPVDAEEALSKLLEYDQQQYKEGMTQLDRSIKRGFTFGVSDLGQKALEAWESGEDYDIASFKYDKEKEEWQANNPTLSLFSEVVPSVMTGTGLWSALGKAGVASNTAKGAIEGGLYGLGTEGVEGMLPAGVFGAAGGRLVDALSKPIGKSGTSEILETPTGPTTKVEYTDFEDLMDQARPIIDRKAAEYVNQTGGVVGNKAQKQIIEETAEEMGVTLREMNEAARTTKGGFRIKDKEIEDLITPDYDAFAKADEALGIEANKGFGAWYGKYVRPIVETMRKRVGEGPAGTTQRLATSSAKYSDYMKSVYHTKPVQAFAKVAQKDNGAFRRALLNMSNQRLKQKTRLKAQKDVLRILKERGGDEAVRGFRDLQKLLMEQQKRTKKYVDATLAPDPLYWPSQVKKQWAALPNQKATRVQKQQNLKEQKRPLIKDDVAAMEYESPDVVLDDMLRGAFNVSELHRNFNLPNLGARAARQAMAEGRKITPKKMRQHIAAGNQTFEELVEALKREGASEETARVGRNMVESIVVNGPKGPNKWVSNFRKAAYMGTIGNPYSAVLNVGDTFNSMLNFGVKNTTDSILESIKRKGGRVTVDDIGMGQQATGEFLRDGVSGAQKRFDDLSDKVFKVSGFQGIDRWGKGVAMNAALKKNKQLAQEGFSEFSDKWKHVFNESEMRQLHADVLAGRKSKLVTDMSAAELSKLQPTDVAALPQWYLDNPNWRVLYMLRTFGIKQLQQMENLVVNQWKAGNKNEAIKNALAYATIVGGGNAAIQEGRQALKGEAPDPTNIGVRWTDHMLGSMSANTLGLYNLSRSVNEKNPVYLASGVVPPIGMVFAPVIDAANAASAETLDIEEAIDDSQMVSWLPFGRLAQSWLGD